VRWFAGVGLQPSCAEQPAGERGAQQDEGERRAAPATAARADDAQPEKWPLSVATYVRYVMDSTPGVGNAGGTD
jgi:hypothetical protein